MITLSRSIHFLFLAALLMLGSCRKTDQKFGDISTPAKPALSITIVGKEATHPDGDGSGKITLVVNSGNAFNYRVDFGDGTSPQMSTSNTFAHGYPHIGTKQFTITVIASGKAGVSSTTSETITIYRAFTPNPELVTMLTGNGTKKWRVDKDAPGHLGVSAGDVFFPAWWAAGPNEKNGLGIYDDVYTFNSTNNQFTHTTNNDIFGKKEYLVDFDPTLTGSDDYTLKGPAAASYTETFGYDGDANTEYITFSKKGHLGMYLGVHKYQVLERSDTRMSLRCLQAPGAWYVKIIAIP